jgi:hypothetical protein
MTYAQLTEALAKEAELNAILQEALEEIAKGETETDPQKIAQETLEGIATRK